MHIYKLVIDGVVIAEGSQAQMHKLRRSQGGRVWMGSSMKVGDRAPEPERDEYGQTAQDRYTDEYGDHNSIYDLDY